MLCMVLFDFVWIIKIKHRRVSGWVYSRLYYLSRTLFGLTVTDHLSTMRGLTWQYHPWTHMLKPCRSHLALWPLQFSSLIFIYFDDGTKWPGHLWSQVFRVFVDDETHFFHLWLQPIISKFILKPVFMSPNILKKRK